MKEGTNSPEKAVFSEDELILLAHLRMSKFTMKSALAYIERTEVSLEQTYSFISVRYKSIVGFFEVLGPMVHERRNEGRLPTVKPPARPRNEMRVSGGSQNARRTV